MHSALSQFTENLIRARELGGLSSAIEAMTTPAIDISDIWRAQIVLAVSALDHFVHELTRFGMIEVSKGVMPKTDAFSRFQIPVHAVESAMSGQPHESWLGEIVREKHSFLSFQDPEKIADAVRLFSDVKLWEAVAAQLGVTPQDLKMRLKLVISRRNKIAHEADMDPTSPGFRWPIDRVMVTETIDFIENIGEAIYSVVTTES